MSNYSRAVTLIVVGLVFVGGVGQGAAHETTTTNGYELTFGGSDEPVVTGERMWLQVEIVDTASGEPVAGQADSVDIAVQRPFGNDTFELEVSEVHGSPGSYEGAVVFTEPGTYTVYINGSVEGTDINSTFSKQVHDASALEYPTDAERSETSESIDGPLGFGLGVITAAIGMAAAFFVGRRA